MAVSEFLLNAIPFWRPLRSYRKDAHRVAVRKFIVLWGISVSPVLIAAFSQPLPTDDNNTLIGFLQNLWTRFNGTHQFIYAVSFITPVLYLLYDRYQEMAAHVLANKRSTKELKPSPAGFGLLLVYCLVVLVFTIVAYANSATRSFRTADTYLDAFSHYTVFIVYLFSLLCWYLHILDSVGQPSIDFTKAIRKQEAVLAARFSDRIEERPDFDE